MNAPLALQKYFVAGGTLWREAPSYITRPADEELFQLALAGEYCNVLAARQMGKSSLMVRTANRLGEAGVRTAILDISTLGGGISAPEAWFFGFIDELAVQLGMKEDVGAWWEAHGFYNPVQRFTNFLRDRVLVDIQGPIAIFVDEIDSALGMAFTDDFFAAIRAAYNARANHLDFQRLTFILLGVARPADLIRDRNRTPYNIGAHIRLSDFVLPELGPFQAVFESVYPGQGSELVAWVLEWTNGQPYLTQKICAELMHLSQEACTPQLVAQTVSRLFFTEEAHKESNLRAILDRIESSPHKSRMVQIYGQILQGQPVLDEERSPAKIELKLTGLVRPAMQGRLEVRNRIYRTVFDQAWVQKSLPPSRTRRIAVAASLLALLAFVVAGYAFYQQRVQAALTFTQQFQTSNSPDVKITSLARLLALDARTYSQARALYAGLSQDEKLSLMTGLSSPQNVAAELVTVIEAEYQDNRNTRMGNEILNAMRTVLGQIGAEGAPGLKTEIEFWLKGREETNDNQDARTALSFYDSAWTESVRRGHPNYSIRFDRALALIELESYALAFDDLKTVWEQVPDRQVEIAALVQQDPTLSAYISVNLTANPAILAFITPVTPTSPGVSPALPTFTPSPSATPVPSPTALPTFLPSNTPILLQGENRVPSPYTGWITYGYGEGTSREIHIMNPLTGAQQQITYNGVIDEAPCFSGDNWTLVYASNRSQDGWELYAYDLHKNTERQLTAFKGQARFPIWSPVPGDTRIVFEWRAFDPEEAINIWMLDTANGELEQLTQDGADSRPGWSPDGTRIVFGRATRDTTGDGRITASDALDIYTLDLTSGVERNLTDTPAFDDFNFAWSPDGEWIAFTSVRLDVNGDGAINLSDSQDLFMIRVDGSDERRLNLEGKQVFSPSWSPDGRFILVLVADYSGQTAIWRFDTRNGNFIQITAPGAYSHPAFSNPALLTRAP